MLRPLPVWKSHRSESSLTQKSRAQLRNCGSPAVATAAAATTATAAAVTAAAVSAAATAAATAITAEATATAATGTGLPFLGFVDAQRAAIDLHTVHRLDGGLRIGIRLHLDEREAARAARVTVEHHADARDLAAVLRE